MTVYNPIVVMNNHDRVEKTEGIKPMNATINTGKVNSYIVQKTVGGYVVAFLNADRSIRNVDGGKVHENRQNAYAKAKRLNDALKRALAKTGMAEAEYSGGYIANAQAESGFDADDQPYEYTLTFRDGEMPPFETKFFGTFDELEQYTKNVLPQPLNWHKVVPEQI